MWFGGKSGFRPYLHLYFDLVDLVSCECSVPIDWRNIPISLKTPPMHEVGSTWEMEAFRFHLYKPLFVLDPHKTLAKINNVPTLTCHIQKLKIRLHDRRDHLALPHH